MPFVVTATAYEYNDEYYDSGTGGIPIAIHDFRDQAESDQWAREMQAWRNCDSLGSYVSGIREWYLSTYSNDIWTQKYRETLDKYANIMNCDPSIVKSGYEYSLPSDITDDQLRQVIVLFDGPCFFSVYEV